MMWSAVQALRVCGWTLMVRTTAHPRHATALAREVVARACDVVVVAGGDGTISEAVDALPGTPTALAVLPLGTGNVWAAEIGLVRAPGVQPPAAVVAAARAPARGRRREVDVERCVVSDDGARRGRARHFLLWAGAGLDARLVRAVEQGPAGALKRRVGNLAYGVVALPLAWRFGGERVTVELDGQRLESQVLMVHVANASRYAGGRVRLAPQARVDDGRLDVCVFRGEGFGQTARHAWAVLRGRHLRSAAVVYRGGREMMVAGSSLPVQVDGDAIGRLPMTNTVVPRALRVCVP
jgi:YegS/Rv2252/BmrU family lipid kinase